MRGDLFDLCRGTVKGRADPQVITLFKSCGTAIEDLATAIMVVAGAILAGRFGYPTATGQRLRLGRTLGGLPPLLDFLEDAKLKEFAALNIVALSDTGVDITAAIPAMLMIDRETSAIEKTNIFHRSRLAIGTATGRFGTPTGRF